MLALAPRILDGLEEFGIAPGAAAIFWRAATADLDQARVEHAWLGIGEYVYLYRMPAFHVPYPTCTFREHAQRTRAWILLRSTGFIASAGTSTFGEP